MCSWLWCHLSSLVLSMNWEESFALNGSFALSTIHSTVNSCIFLKQRAKQNPVFHDVQSLTFYFIYFLEMSLKQQIPTLNTEHIFMISCWFMYPSILIHRFIRLYNLRWEKQTSPAINNSALPEKSLYSVTEVFQSNSRGQAVITQHSTAFCGWPANVCPSN